MHDDEKWVEHREPNVTHVVQYLEGARCGKEAIRELAQLFHPVYDRLRADGGIRLKTRPVHVSKAVETIREATGAPVRALDLLMPMDLVVRQAWMNEVSYGQALEGCLLGIVARPFADFAERWLGVMLEDSRAVSESMGTGLGKSRLLRREQCQAALAAYVARTRLGHKDGLRKARQVIELLDWALPIGSLDEGGRHWIGLTDE